MYSDCQRHRQISKVMVFIIFFFGAKFSNAESIQSNETNATKSVGDEASLLTSSAVSSEVVTTSLNEESEPHFLVQNTKEWPHKTSETKNCERERIQTNKNTAVANPNVKGSLPVNQNPEESALCDANIPEESTNTFRMEHSELMPVLEQNVSNEEINLGDDTNATKTAVNEASSLPPHIMSSDLVTDGMNDKLEPQFLEPRNPELPDMRSESKSCEPGIHQTNEKPPKEESGDDSKISEINNAQAAEKCFISVSNETISTSQTEHPIGISLDSDAEITAGEKNTAELKTENSLVEPTNTSPQSEASSSLKMDDGKVSLTEKEEDSYVLGMMVADYTRLSVLRSLEKLNIYPDRKLVVQGIMDSLSDRALLDDASAQRAMQRIVTSNSVRQAEKEELSRKLLSTLSNKNDTLERHGDRVWVRLKKGDRRVNKQTPIKLSWKGKIYDGEEFEEVNNSKVTKFDKLPSWLQQGVRLAEYGGEIRLFILASSIEKDVTLPLGTAPYEIIQFTVKVEK